MDSQGLQVDFGTWVAATADPAELKLHVAGFTYADLFVPERLAELTAAFDAWFRERDAPAHARFDAYRACRGEGMKPEAVSEALLAAAPHLSAFVQHLFGVEREVAAFAREVRVRDPLWHFKKEFAKKRLFKPTAGKGWTGSAVEAAHAARRALIAMGAKASLLESGSDDEEMEVARAVLLLHEVDDVARKAAKERGYNLVGELHGRQSSTLTLTPCDP